MRAITHIVLHCTATPQTTTVESIQNYWKNIMKWKQPGYHIVILPDGTEVDLLPIEQVSNGVGGYNSTLINISYIGGVDDDNKPLDNRTPAQIDAQIRLVKKYKAMFPKAKVVGHRDFPGVKKACPSFDVKKWLKTVGLAILVLVLLLGCNAAKKVMKNKEDFNKVGEAWSKDHPCVNDTVSQLIPGDTIIQDGGTRIDTLYSVADGKTIFRTRTIYKTVHDTLIKYIRDTRAEKVLGNEVNRTRDTLNQTIIQRNSFEASRNGWRRTVYTICGIGVLLLIGGYIFFRYLLRPQYK